MTSGAPWSVKGIDPKAREIAKDLAHRSGMTLGEWLNQMIFEDGAKPSDIENAPSRVAALARPISESRSLRRGDDLERVLASIEAMASRLDATEKQQAEAAARFDAALTDLRADQAKVAERLQTVGGGSSRADTLRALDAALGQLGRHIEEGEGRNREALAALRAEIGREVERIADQVTLKVRDVENHSADAIAQVGAEVTRVAAVVEQRLRRADDAQAEALEKLGAEIARITERLSERIAAAERRSAQAIDDVGEQMARVTDRIHQRQERTLSEIGDRMRQSEERTAKLLEDAREKIERRMGRRDSPEDQAEASVSVARDPGETQVALAESAATPPFGVPRWGSGGSLAVPPQHPSTAAAVQEPAFVEPPALIPAPAAVPVEAPFDYLDRPIEIDPTFDDAASKAERASEEALLFEDTVEPTSVAKSIFEVEPRFERDPTVAEDRVMTVAEMLAAASSDINEADPGVDLYHAPYTPQSQLDEAEPLDLDAIRSAEPADAPDDAQRPSTRELIAAARAAARVNSEDPAYHAPDLAHAEDTDSVFNGAGQRRARMSGAMRGVLLTGGAAVSLGLAASGYLALHPEMLSSFKHAAPAKRAEATKPIPVGPPSAPAAVPAQATQAMTLTTTLTPAAPKPAPVPAEPDAGALFRDASVKVDMGDPAGVAPLRTAANLGYAPAQRRLGKLYEDGGAGVKKDEAEGRRWTQRAAANGDARGMHNLGLDYYEGTGGVKNMAVAAQWFERAAELGLRDSQYNLARFYESGLGVKQDLATAYKWYLIAGRAGDTEAAARGEALRSQLTPEARASGEKAAMAFRADPAPQPTSLAANLKSATPQQLALAQRALTKLGYYQGPSDGVASQSLGEAIQSYQRDRNLTANGALSPELVQSFANVSR